MTKMDIDKALTETATKIFENAAFALIDFPEDDGGEKPIIERIAASVKFTGPNNGVLCMAIQAPLAATFAENMLGTDPGDPDAASKGHDAMKELLNMICGNLLPRLFGIDKEFKIDAPVESDTEYFDSAYGGENSGRASLIVEGREVYLAFCVD